MNDLEVHTVVVGKGMFEENCYLLVCRKTREAAIVDPGAMTRSESESLIEFVTSKDAKVKFILNTHGHLDHIAGNGALQAATGAEILVHEGDARMLTEPHINGSALFGLSVVSPEASRTLADGDTLAVGTVTLRVLHTPGHTPGGLCFAGPGFVFSGDTLFSQSIGRTDFPGGSQDDEIESIRTKLFVLPEDTIVYPGHGSSTSIGIEKRSNPFLR